MTDQPEDPKLSKKGQQTDSRISTRQQLFHLTDAMFAKWKADYQETKPVGQSGFRGVRLNHTRKKGGQEIWKACGRTQTRAERLRTDRTKSKRCLGLFTSKHTAAHVRDYHILKNNDNVSVSSIAVKLNFHPRTYLTADGELLPLRKVLGADFVDSTE